MPYQIGTASNYLDLLDKVRRFAGGYGVAGAPTPGANTGNGTVTGVDTHPASVTETITLTCTATAPDGGTFSVVGSVSGTLASATVGTPYISAVIDFTINDGSTDFAISDSFTIAVTEGALTTAGEAWVEERWTGGNELILRGKGVSGTEQLYVGIKAYEDTGADYYNFELRGYIGYLPGSAFAGQPGVSPASYCYLWNSAIPYWLVVNGNRIICIAKVSTVYEGFYLGRFLPYGTPSQYPYPLFIGGCDDTQAQRFSVAESDHRMFFCPGKGVQVYWVDGTWHQFTNRYGTGVADTTHYSRNMWPYRFDPNYDLTLLRDNPDGTYTLLPIILSSDAGYPAKNNWGELEGCYWVSGFANAAENLINIGGTDHLVVPSIQRTGTNDYMALKLE